MDRRRDNRPIGRREIRSLRQALSRMREWAESHRHSVDPTGRIFQIYASFSLTAPLIRRCRTMAQYRIILERLQDVFREMFIVQINNLDGLRRRR